MKVLGKGLLCATGAALPDLANPNCSSDSTCGPLLHEASGRYVGESAVRSAQPPSSAERINW
jgi:hypothetical protein